MGTELVSSEAEKSLLHFRVRDIHGEKSEISGAGEKDNSEGRG